MQRQRRITRWLPVILPVTKESTARWAECMPSTAHSAYAMLDRIVELATERDDNYELRQATREGE